MALWREIINVASILALGAGVVLIWIWLFRCFASEPQRDHPRLRLAAELCIGAACLGAVVISLATRLGAP